MSFIEAVRLALAQIRGQKLKSAFVLVGVTIGVMFLIGVVSIVEGMGRAIEGTLAVKLFGLNTFTLRRTAGFTFIVASDASDANAQQLEQARRQQQRRPPIVVQDGEAVHDVLPSTARWALENASGAALRSEYATAGSLPNVALRAVTPQYFGIKNLAVTSGRVFTEQENQRGAPVVVIGPDIARVYFPGLDPLGKPLRLAGIPFRVIGVLEPQGSDIFGMSLDQQVLAPFRSPLQRGVGQAVWGVIVQAPSLAAVGDMQETVRELMRRRHRLHPSEPDDFVFESSQSSSMLAMWAGIKKKLVLAGIVLPAIGLVVGAIVILNIMLVAVAERTREIGIRKSLGARRRDILAQFLVEATTLSTLGAGLGILGGMGLAKLVSSLAQHISSSGLPLHTSVPLWSVVLSLGVGVGVGVLAGIYPASRAARIDPILALRAEP